MSTIIMQADRPNGYLHQVQTTAGDYYWISTANVAMPLGRGFETAAIKCRKNGSVSKGAFEAATIWNHGRKPENLEVKHFEICNNLEELL